MNQQKNILDVLEKISDMEFQKTVWVKQLYWDYVLNFGEAVNTLEDYGFFNKIEEGEIKFEKRGEQEKLEKFVMDLFSYEEPVLDIAKMMKDPEWIKISKNAGEIYDLLFNFYEKGNG